MKLNDYLDALNLELEARRYPNQGGRWLARFGGVELRQGGCLVGAYGTGTSLEDAVVDYLNRVCGKPAVKNASGENRFEFMIPTEIDP